MVERFHRQLKAAIRCQADENWVRNLPLVLLGIRATWKEDLRTTSVELVYGENVRLPGEFLARQQRDEPLLGPADFVNQLRWHLRDIRPTVANTVLNEHLCRETWPQRLTCSYATMQPGVHYNKNKPIYNGP